MLPCSYPSKQREILLPPKRNRNPSFSSGLGFVLASVSVTESRGLLGLIGLRTVTGKQNWLRGIRKFLVVFFRKNEVFCFVFFILREKNPLLSSTQIPP
jgi:hypothetical protein